MQVIDKLKSGELIPAGMLNAISQGAAIMPGGVNGSDMTGAGADGFVAAGVNNNDNKPVIKRNYDAVTDDIKQIASQWNVIISSIDDALLMNFLKQAYVTVTEDGNSLEIMIKSLSGYNAISREETVTMLEELIEERTGVSVRIVVTKMDEDEDFNKRYVALEELVGMNIEIDDKEEFI